MLIIADENIPFAQEAFSEFGEVKTFPGRAITATELKGAAVLLVRSVTQVNEALLQDAKELRFVGTATIGTDHVDTAYLAKRGIPFYSAPGCNANSVAEYIVAALLELEQRLGRPLAGSSLGIVGIGHIGTIVNRYAQILGMQCVLHDPPRAAIDSDCNYQPIEAICDCDFITLHVPLEKAGKYPTHHLVDKNFLCNLTPQTVLLNTSRGSVVDNQALKHALIEKKLAAAVLDVWEGEPNPDSELVELCAISTPHIAGYSYDGKVNATAQLRTSLCGLLGMKDHWDAASLMPQPEIPDIQLENMENTSIHGVMQRVYDIMGDHSKMLHMLNLPENDRAAYFDLLRKSYPVRREAKAFSLMCAKQETGWTEKFSALGFKIKVD